MSTPTVTGPHAVMLPYPYQGHINPFARLALNLAAEGFTVTFINTHSVDCRISRARGDGDVFRGARASGLDIRYATVCDGFPLSFDRVLNHDQFVEGLIHVFPAHIDEFFENLAGDDPPATCLIADTFYVWGSAIARKHNLVYVSFWTEPALVFSLYYHLDLLRDNGHFDSSGENRKKDIIDYIPGVEAINPTDLPSYLQSENTTTVVHRVIYKAFDDVKMADIIICNTVQKMEDKTLSALHHKQATYAIGPIISDVFTASLWLESDCSEWLRTKPKGSVLYVSFGSHASITSRHTISEIAHGLLMSEVNFMWVIRPDIVGPDETNIFPDGFKKCLGARGLIVKWCNQFKVLSDPAIGGFLSHCGWNSVLESIRFKVPIICFPLFTDQFTNRKLVVNDWKIGINLCDSECIKRDEVKEKIRFVIGAETSEQLREAMKDVGWILDEALGRNGSSVGNFKVFIEQLMSKMNVDRRQ